MAFNSSWLQQASLYKFRYLLGYGFVIALMLFLVLSNVTGTPSGLSQAEMSQAVTSTSLHFSWDLSWLVNLPHVFAQKISIEALGLSRLSLVIPSLVFGSITAIMFTLTMRQWFRDAVAVVATIISLSSIAFISMTRSATPEIMLSFWLSLLIFGAVRLLIKRDRAFIWKLLIVIASIGLLYTPCGIYALVAIFGSAFFHPHVRSRFRHIKRSQLFIISIIVCLGLAPFIAYMFLNQPVLVQLLNIDAIRYSLQHLHGNILQLFDMYGNIFKSGFAGTIIVPVFNVAVLALALLGILQSVKNRFTARSYILLSWTAMSIVIALLMPTVVAFVFLPVAFLTAIGINTLVTQWYSLFPKNPYARVAGLIPLTVLFLGISAGNISHYFNNHLHIANPFYSESLPAVRSALKTEGDHAVILVTQPADVPFYSILKKEHRYLTVTSTLPANTDTPTLILPNVQEPVSFTPSRILTSASKDDSVVLRVYRPR